MQVIQDLSNSKVLLEHHPRLKTVLKQHNGFIHNPEQVAQALKYDVSELKELAAKIKLPVEVILRLVDLIVFSHMESSQINHKVHDAFRIAVKKRLYVRCMRTYPELFKGKKQQLLGNSVGFEPFIWNSVIQGDEMCQVSLKQLQEESKEQSSDFLTKEGIKIQLKQMYQDMEGDFVNLKPKIKKVLTV